MQFIDLHAQQGRIRQRIEDRIKKVLDHGRYILGPEVKEIEETLARYVGVRYAVGVASGTDALLMGLMAHDVGPGDAVFTSPFTFIATAEVIQLLGAAPVFVDIEPDTFNMDVEKLEDVIMKTQKQGEIMPRGIMPVDLFGQTADYDEINAVAEKHGLFVLEDAAQSFGASYKGRQACSLSGVAATSFFPAKPLGCYGDGGMVFTDDDAMYEKLLSIRVHGQGVNKYENIRLGVNGRLDTLQAAILLAKFEIFAEEIEMRQQVARRYDDGLRDVVTVPHVKDHNISAWAQYSVLHPQRDNIMARLKENGIPTAIYYPKPLHLQQAFANLCCNEGDFPISEKIADKIFSLPFHPYFSEDDQARIFKLIKSVCET
jgi:UDP-2-acetamido-2-deoxy-ribo-hexuluronate aminotransferase